MHSQFAETDATIVYEDVGVNTARDLLQAGTFVRPRKKNQDKENKRRKKRKEKAQKENKKKTRRRRDHPQT
jgi:hypothetical protein